MKVYRIGKNYRFTLYSPILIRAEYSGSGIFDEDNPIIVEPDFIDEVFHQVESTDTFFKLRTKFFELKVTTDGKTFDIGNFSFKVFDSLNGPQTFEPGITDTQNLGGAMLDLYKYPAGKFYERFTDGLISKNGYWVFRNHCEFLWDKDRNWFKKRSEWDFCDWYLFGYGKNYKDAFENFIRIFGKIPMVPRWAFGYWYSRWYKFKDTDILSIIKRFRELDIPLDVFVIDTDWRKHSWNGYEWNSEFFPNPEKFLAELKKQNIKCCLNDHPGYGISDELPHDDPYREKIKKHIPEIKEYRVLWNDDRYVHAWMKEIFTKILDEGVDFWWVDGWGASGGIMDLHTQMWLNRFYFQSAAETKDKRRPVILSRWGGVGSHRYPVQFSGDTYSNFETLKYQIVFTHKGGNIGAAYWSHDIGGFLGGNISEDLFIRWVQFGSFSPIFRTHSSGASRDVWNYSKRAVAVFRKYTKIRYALNSYFYSLAYECHKRGLPIVRGLYIEYPDDKNAYIYEDEYLIGESILVAPAYGPGDVFQREVYFPEGVWYSLEDSDVIKGPCVKVVEVPLKQIPVYIKSNSIIPTTKFLHTIPTKIDNIELNIFPEGRCEFLHYEDDGWSNRYKSGEFLIRHISIEKRPDKIEISTTSKGHYSEQPECVDLVINLLTDNEVFEGVFVNEVACEANYTDTVFSNTVKSAHRFLRIDCGKVKDNLKVEIRTKK